jgi:polar amino acid transport system substrate-binding protein
VGLAQLNYLTEDWAPFNYEKNGLPAGISVEILDAVFRVVGVNRSGSDVRIAPLAAGLRQAQENTSTVLFSIARTPEREALYKWAGPFTKSSFVLFAPTSRNITITSPADLNKYRIGAVNASVENSLLLNMGVNAVNIVNGVNPDELLQMLAEGQIDMWATGDVTGQYEIMMNAKVNFSNYEEVYTLSEDNFYFVFSKDVPDSLVNSFQHVLEIVHNQKDTYGVSEYERIIYRNLMVGYARQQFTNDAVVALVNTTAAAIETNATDTFMRINAKQAPYRDPENSGLYVFVYDTNETMVAHADNILLVGVNFKGKTDVTGKPFRDYIVTGALANGTGWVEYVYVNPAQTNLYYKTTYYQLVVGSDGNSYVVCSGNFKSQP